jgi:hypothetical protein
MRSGSIIVVTVAARKPPHSAPVPREQWLRERFLNAVPATLPAKFFETESLSEYPSHLVRLLNETIHESVRVAVGRRAYRPLFSFAYRDGQAMATAGGIVVNKRDSARVDRSSALRMRGVGSDVTVLDVPLLTVREKAALDHLMPTRAVSERRARRGGVHLPADALASYARWYREYPIFAEIELR